MKTPPSGPYQNAVLPTEEKSCGCRSNWVISHAPKGQPFAQPRATPCGSGFILR